MKRLIIAILLIAAPAFAWDFEKIMKESQEPDGYLVKRPDLALELVRQLAFDYARDFDRGLHLRNQVKFWGDKLISMSVSDPSYSSTLSLYRRFSDELEMFLDERIKLETNTLCRCR